MKILPISLLILIILAGVFIVLKKDAQAPSEKATKEETNISHEKKSVNEETEQYTIQVEYPHVSGIQTSEKINEKIENFVTSSISEFKKQAGETELFGDIKSTFEIEYNWRQVQHGILPVQFLVYTYSSGAAHPLSFYTVQNFDVKTGEHLSIKDLFKSDDYLNQLSVLSKEHVKGEAEKRGYSLDSSWVNEGTSPKEENFKTFILEKNHLKIIFDPYQVTAYAAGIVEIEIPLERLEGLSI